MLELPERRAYRWIGRRAGGQLADKAPGGSPMHWLLADEVAEILALFDEWGETDRPHRKLAHRGSYLGRVWVFPSSVGRVLFLAGQAFPAAAQAWAQRAQAVPDWVDYRPTACGSTTRPTSLRVGDRRDHHGVCEGCDT